MPRYIDAVKLSKVYMLKGKDKLRLSTVINELELAPTEDVQEVKHAKFELVQNGKGVCSNCHRLDSIDDLAKYCRYCGAQIDESAPDIYVGSRKE